MAILQVLYALLCLCINVDLKLLCLVIAVLATYIFVYLLFESSKDGTNSVRPLMEGYCQDILVVPSELSSFFHFKWWSIPP